MQIYVASLADYNNGYLHGKWVDLEGADIDDVMGAIAEVLRTSKFPNVHVECPTCEGEGCEHCANTGKVPSAEEWAIFDYDDIPSEFGENPDLEDLLNYVELVAEHGEAYRVFHDTCCCAGEVANEDEFLRAYAGSARTFVEWVWGYIEDTGMLSGLPEDLHCFFDAEAFGRAFEMNGDVSVAHDDFGLCHVFRNR